MGDVRTHSQIFETFVRPNLPDDVDPVYVEFGNYLTDVSQFLDPWAHVGGKGTVWRDQVGLGWRLSLLADIAGADGYLDFLLGLPDAKNPTGPSRHGKLAAWFREVIYVYSLEDRFKEGGDPSRYLIDPPEFKRLYDLNFTQYYPHEHLDFQPDKEGNLNDFSQSTESAAAGNGPRRIVGYLDRQIEYVGDLLTLIEQDWARSEDVDAARERELLVKFGHACHAVEDFFFHSNFVDLAHEVANPNQPVTPFDPEDTKDDTDPEGKRIPAPDSPRWDRIYFRRKRQPIFGEDKETGFDDEDSLEANNVFTASIPLPDIFYTFFDAIGHFAPKRGVPPPFDVMPLVQEIETACASEHPGRSLIAILRGRRRDDLKKLPMGLLSKFVPGDNETKKQEAEREKAYKAYKCIVDKVPLGALRLVLLNKGFDRSTVDAVERAIEIERELWEKLDFDISGAAKFMILLLEKGKKDVLEARGKTEELDRRNTAEESDDVEEKNRSGYVASDNSSFAERIGTHALMSKDSIRKQPLRRQAISGAGFTVSYITKTLVNQRKAASRVKDGVDWYELLRHFLTHPEQAGATAGTQWWRSALLWDPEAGTRPDEMHTVKSASKAAIANRAQEATRKSLEPDYNRLVTVGQERFREAINADWVLGTMTWAWLAGTITGAIGAAGESAEITVLGGLVGGFTGAVAGGLLSGIGTEIDDSAGAVVGLITGLTAAGFGGYGIGRAIGD